MCQGKPPRPHFVFIYEGELSNNQPSHTMTTPNSFFQRFSIGQFFASALIATASVGAVHGVAFADSRLGVSIDVGAKGDALIRGAEVTAVSDSEVKAETSWGNAVLNWVITTDSDTEYLGTNGHTVARNEISVGDTISFRGTIDQALSALTVKAKVVKDWSMEKTEEKFSGTVASINASLNSFVVMRGNATTTVETNSSTQFTVKGDDAAFGDIALNSKVKLEGSWNASSTVFTASKVEIKDRDSHKGKKWRSWFRSNAWLKFNEDH